MKNFRNGPQDVSPPLHHADPRPCFTGLRLGSFNMAIGPGPRVDVMVTESDGDCHLRPFLSAVMAHHHGHLHETKH